MEKKIGRPRSEETKIAILKASYDLLLEKGFAAITVDKISERAEVSKATIYKWWPNKAAVVMDGFLAAAVARLPVPNTGSAINDLLIQVNNLTKFLNSREGKVITELIAVGQHDSNLAEAYRTRYFNPRRLDSKHILERGILSGELRNDLDLELSIDLIYGPIFYRLLVTGEVIDDSFVSNLLNSVLEGIKKRP